VAALPVLPAIAAMVAFVRFLRTMDELQRRIHFEALVIAFAAAILITFSYGFLETAGLPAIPWIWIAPMMIVLWGVTAGIGRRGVRACAGRRQRVAIPRPAWPGLAGRAARRARPGPGTG
jgi:hypothetical protein